MYEEDLPSPWFEGYDLVAVLIHKGRNVDSGHYVAWVKQDSRKWIEFDDEQPILQKEDDITKLSGGGDWHMAYICFSSCSSTLNHMSLNSWMNWSRLGASHLSMHEGS